MTKEEITLTLKEIFISIIISVVDITIFFMMLYSIRDNYFQDFTFHISLGMFIVALITNLFLGYVLGKEDEKTKKEN